MDDLLRDLEAGPSDVYGAVQTLRGPLLRASGSVLGDDLWIDDSDFLSDYLPPLTKLVAARINCPARSSTSHLTKDYVLQRRDGEPLEDPLVLVPLLEVEGQLLMLETFTQFACRLGLLDSLGNICIAVYLPEKRGRGPSRPHLRLLEVINVERLKFGDFELPQNVLLKPQVLSRPLKPPTSLACCQRNDNRTRHTLPVVVRRPDDGRVQVQHERKSIELPAPVKPPMMEGEHVEPAVLSTATPLHMASAGRLSFSRITNSLRARRLVQGADYKTLKKLRLSTRPAQGLPDRAVQVMLRGNPQYLTLIFNSFNDAVDAIELLAIAYIFKRRKILPLELRGSYEQKGGG